MNPKVTIGVCVKNREKTIKEAVDGIISQKYPSELIQIIIVDGGSKDKTLSIIASVAARSVIKTEIYSDNGKGLGVARQIVINKANSEYIIFVDSDVKLPENFVENHVKLMEDNPDVCVAFGKPLFEEGTIVSSVWNLFQSTIGYYSGNDATIYRTEALINVGGFDPNIKGAGEDDDILNRLRAKGWIVSVNEKARFIHKNRENLGDFILEQAWFGYGGHYFSHKNNRYPDWHQNLLGAFIYGLKSAFKAYKQTHRKLSFLIFWQVVLCRTSWWFGYFKAHINGYGHKIKE